MKYKVIISNSVWDCLEKQIKSYLNINSLYAEKINESFIKRIERIVQNPYMYKALLYYPEYRYTIIMKKFLLIYKIKNNEIWVLYFVDGRRDFSSFIK